MRRNDLHSTNADGIPFLFAKSPLPPGHPGWLEQGAASPIRGDFTDDPAFGWENAWIDLGGEG